MKYLIVGLLLLGAICTIGVSALAELRITEIDTMTGRLKVYLYVFNDKTQLWDRAREETVKNIQCDKLRGVGLPSGDEYLIDKDVLEEIGK